MFRPVERRGRSTKRIVAIVIVAWICSMLLAACAGSGVASDSRSPTLALHANARAGQVPPSPASRPATLGLRSIDPSKINGVQLNVLSGLENDTPIFDGDFADPFALRTSDAIYLFATNTVKTPYAPAAHIPVIALTRDSWFEGHYLGDALPILPAWTVSGYQWAPSVWARPGGTYVMYYSTPATHPLNCLGREPAAACIHTSAGPRTAYCISRATSSSPAGPFVDGSSSAFVCPVSEGGAIDPSVFIDSEGTPWLLWKSDGDCCGLPTRVYSQQLSADGLSVIGSPHRLIEASQSWEGGLVEGPSMVEQGKNYWLFYSANLWGSDDYGIGIAHCASVIGPCTKPLDHAWISSTVTDGQSDPGPGGRSSSRSGVSFGWSITASRLARPGTSPNAASTSISWCFRRADFRGSLRGRRRRPWRRRSSTTETLNCRLSRPRRTSRSSATSETPSRVRAMPV